MAKEKLGLKELIAMGIGGMIGGGIFSVLGLAIDIAGNAAPIAFGLGGLIAFLAGYSYVKLSLAFPSDGSSYVYLSRAFPQHQYFASFFGWAVILGYIGTLALYAFTFGAYGADLLGLGGSDVTRGLLSVAVLVALMFVNLQSVFSSGLAADLLVYTKILILAFFAFVGLHEVDTERAFPLFNHGISSVFMGGALIYVSYEGFQLITNEITESENIKRNIPRSIYTSIFITSVIYVSIALIASTTLSISEIREAKEYALAVVAEPYIGTGGRVLIGIAALLATSSAINSTLFGASRMMAVMADYGRMPKALARINERKLPWVSVITLTGLGVLFTTLNSLETIASFSSIVFLLVCASVSIANLKLRKKTDANTWIVITSIVLSVITTGLLFLYLYENNEETLVWVASLFLCVLIAERSYKGKKR